MIWALKKNDPDGWLIEDFSLITSNDQNFKPQLDRYKYPNRYPDEDCSNARDKAEVFLKTLENKLEKQAYIAGQALSILDVAIFPFIRQCANVDRDWFDNLPYPKLQKWLSDRLESSIFKHVMQKNLEKT